MDTITTKVVQVPISIARHMIKPIKGDYYHQAIHFGLDVSMRARTFQEIKDAYKDESLISIRVHLNEKNWTFAKENQRFFDMTFRWVMVAACYYATQDPHSPGHSRTFAPITI